MTLAQLPEFGFFVESSGIGVYGYFINVTNEAYNWIKSA